MNHPQMHQMIPVESRPYSDTFAIPARLNPAWYASKQLNAEISRQYSHTISAYCTSAGDFGSVTELGSFQNYLPPRRDDGTTFNFSTLYIASSRVRFPSSQHSERNTDTWRTDTCLTEADAYSGSAMQRQSVLHRILEERPHVEDHRSHLHCTRSAGGAVSLWKLIMRSSDMDHETLLRYTRRRFGAPSQAHRNHDINQALNGALPAHPLASLAYLLQRLCHGRNRNFVVLFPRHDSHGNCVELKMPVWTDEGPAYSTDPIPDPSSFSSWYGSGEWVADQARECDYGGEDVENSLFHISQALCVHDIHFRGDMDGFLVPCLNFKWSEPRCGNLQDGFEVKFIHSVNKHQYPFDRIIMDSLAPASLKRIGPTGYTRCSTAVVRMELTPGYTTEPPTLPNFSFLCLGMYYLQSSLSVLFL